MTLSALCGFQFKGLVCKCWHLLTFKMKLGLVSRVLSRVKVQIVTVNLHKSACNHGFVPRLGLAQICRFILRVFRVKKKCDIEFLQRAWQNESFFFFLL